MDKNAKESLPYFQDVIEPPLYQTQLVGFVEDDELALELRLGRVLEVFDVSRDDFAIGDEVALAVDHVGDHHDLVNVGVGKLEGQFGCLDVKGQHDAVRPLDEDFVFDNAAAGQEAE